MQHWGFDLSGGHWSLNHLHGYISSRFGHAGSLWVGLRGMMLVNDGDGDDDEAQEEDMITVVTVGRGQCAEERGPGGIIGYSLPSLWIFLAYIKFDLILLQVVLKISHGVCNDDILPDSLLCIC